MSQVPDQSKHRDNSPHSRASECSNLIDRGAKRPSSSRMAASSKIPSRTFYDQYHGHNEGYLQQITDEFRSRNKGIIWFAGDSTLDNKYWFNAAHDACNGYEDLLNPPQMKADVCYWTNYELSRNRSAFHLVCVNTAVEATTLSGRSCCRLLGQDKVIQENIGENDYLVVSIGGNDIALQVNSTRSLSCHDLTKKNVFFFAF